MARNAEPAGGAVAAGGAGACPRSREPDDDEKPQRGELEQGEDIGSDRAGLDAEVVDHREEQDRAAGHQD